MLDVAFVKLIGTGISSLARAANKLGPAVEHTEGAALIRELFAAEPERANKLVMSIVSGIWSHCDVVGLPGELALTHIEPLTQAFHKYVFDPETAQKIMRGAADFDSATEARQLADTALAQNIFDLGTDDKLDEAIACYMFEALIIAIFQSAQDLQSLETQIAQFIGAEPEPTTPRLKAAAPKLQPLSEVIALAPQANLPVRAADLSPALNDSDQPQSKMKRADALGITVHLLEAITVHIVNKRKTPDLEREDLDSAFASAITLCQRLDNLIAAAEADVEPMRDALSLVKAGRLTEADHALARAENREVRGAQLERANAQNRLQRAIYIRATRAILQETRLEFVRSARHFGFAQRYIHRNNQELRWLYTRQEALSYAKAAEFNHEFGALVDAANILTSELAKMAQHEKSRPRAEAQVDLARVLVLLGDQDEDASRYLLAAQLLDDSVQLFEDHQPKHDYLTAVAVRADVHTMLGIHDGNYDLLEQAVFAYQNVLDEISAELPDSDEAEFDVAGFENIRERMALALAAVGGLRNQKPMIEAAINLMTAIEKTQHEDPPRLNLRQLCCRAHYYLAIARFETASLASGGTDLLSSTVENVVTKYFRLAEHHFGVIGNHAKSAEAAEERQKFEMAQSNPGENKSTSPPKDELSDRANPPA